MRWAVLVAIVAFAFVSRMSNRVDAMNAPDGLPAGSVTSLDTLKTRVSVARQLAKDNVIELDHARTEAAASSDPVRVVCRLAPMQG